MSLLKEETMLENRALWDLVCKTNPAHTKAVKFGRAITAIDPYRQFERATEVFGPVGLGWGWDVVQTEYLAEIKEMGVLIRFWHGDGKGFMQWGQAGLYIDKDQKKKDSDLLKKATTDAVTKCLSLLGFNADIFLGKFDDNKYVQEMHNEFSNKNVNGTQIPKAPQLASKEILAAIKTRLKAINETPDKLVEYFNAKNLEDLTEADALKAIGIIELKEAKVMDAKQAEFEGEKDESK